MAREVFVVVFDTIVAAEAAKRDLEATGIPSADVNIRSGAATEAATTGDEASGGFWDWLFRTVTGEEQGRDYGAHIERGRAVLSITADSADYDRVAAILHRYDLVKTGEEHVAEERTTMAPAGSPQRGAKRKTVIPTAKEELEVGKRQAADTAAYRIRRYVIERPVETQVPLHEERVTVERRQPTRAVPGEHALEEKVVEATETREEPVVSKVVKPGEEVVVRKEAQDRTETVRETVRESKVEVDKAAAGDKPPADKGRRGKRGGRRP